MSQRPHPIDAQALVFLTLPPLFWASNAVLGRMVADTIGPLVLNTMRWVLAGLFLLPFALRPLIAHRQVLRERWRMLALMGFLAIGAYNSLQYLGLQTSTPLNITLIGSSGPVFIVVLGALFFREPMTRRQIGGGLLSMLGVLAVLARGEPAALLGMRINAGDLYMLLATVCWSFYTWLLRRHRPVELSQYELLLVQIGWGVLFFLPLTLGEIWLGIMPTRWDGESALVMVYVALFPALISYVCWDRGVARVGAQLPVFFTNLTPLFTAVMAALLLGEAPHSYHLLGLLLIIGGIALARR